MRAWLLKIRDTFAGNPALPLPYLLTALIVAILLQLQLTFFKTEGYLGLRLNAADLILPLAGLLIFMRLVLRRDALPEWRIKGIYWWLLALTAVMSFALLKGHATIGEWDRWAIINKYIGWYVLLAYLGLGGWIGSRPVAEWLKGLMSLLIAAWVCTLVIAMGKLMWIDMQGNTHQILLNYPLAGVMGNRNAYAFLSFSMLAIITALQLRQAQPPSWGFYVLWALVPLLYCYNASRAGLVILAFLIIAFCILNLKFAARRILLPFLIGALATFFYFSSFDSYAMQITGGHVKNSAQLIELGYLTPEQAKDKFDYVGDKVRTETYGDAIELWRQHPLTGGGLGAFRDYQTEKRGKFSDVIDCTGLWLLSETGLIGLGLFAGLFLMSMWKLFLKIRMGTDPYGIYLGFLLVMMIFGIMSLVHELLYTRFLWFFMGLALALPPEERKAYN